MGSYGGVSFPIPFFLHSLGASEESSAQKGKETSAASMAPQLPPSSGVGASGKGVLSRSKRSQLSLGKKSKGRGQIPEDFREGGQCGQRHAMFEVLLGIWSCAGGKENAGEALTTGAEAKA